MCPLNELPLVDNLESWVCRKTSSTECVCDMLCEGRDEPVESAVYCHLVPERTIIAEEDEWQFARGWSYSRMMPQCPIEEEQGSKSVLFNNFFRIDQSPEKFEYLIENSRILIGRFK